MFAPEEGQRIPLEARLCEHANHTDDELLRSDLIAAIKKLDWAIAQIADMSAEMIRLERLTHSVSPY